MRRRAVAALALAAIGISACGGGDVESSGQVAWAKEPLVFTPEGLPRDRILSGRIENDSLRPVRLVAKELRLLDADGRRVDGSAVLLESFAHQLYPPGREPAGGVPESERIRLGVEARLEPGKDVPLTIAWRQAAGTKPPVTIDTGSGTLPIRR